MKTVLRYIGFATAALILGVMFDGAASAEPYIAVRQGKKCSMCHVNKNGGGKRTGFGEMYLQTRLAAEPMSWPGVEGQPEHADLAHGHLSETFSVGGDFRFKWYDKYPMDGDRTHEFQSESAAGHGYSYVYLHMEPVPDRVTFYTNLNLGDPVSARETFILFEDLPMDGYLKVGTFRLFSAFHTMYDEPFAHATPPFFVGRKDRGIEYGIEPGPYSVKLSVTNGDNTGTPDKMVALTTYAAGGMGMAGLTYAMLPTGAAQDSVITTIFAGTSFGPFTMMLEQDTRVATDESGDTSTESTTEIGLLELNYLFSKGHNIKIKYDYEDPSADVEGDIQDRRSLVYEPFYNQFLQMRYGFREYDGPPGSRVGVKYYFVEIHLMY